MQNNKCCEEIRSSIFFKTILKSSTLDPPWWVSLLCSGNNPTDVSAVSTLAFYLGVAFHHQSIQAPILSLAKACRSPPLILHRMKEWTDLHVDETCWMTRTNDINFYPTLLQHLSNISSNMLDKMLDQFN